MYSSLAAPSWTACVPHRKWKMALAGAKNPQDVRVCFCRSHGAAGILEVHVMARLTPALNLTRLRAWKQTWASWGLKNSFQPPKLNWPWINHTSQAMQWLQSSLCRPWVSNLTQVACHTACTHPKSAGTSEVPEDAPSQRKTGLCFCLYLQDLSFTEEPLMNKPSFSACRTWSGSSSQCLNTAPLPRTRALWPHARHLQEMEAQLLSKGKNDAWEVME